MGIMMVWRACMQGSQHAPNRYITHEADSKPLYLQETWIRALLACQLLTLLLALLARKRIVVQGCIFLTAGEARWPPELLGSIRNIGMCGLYWPAKLLSWKPHCLLAD